VPLAGWRTNLGQAAISVSAAYRPHAGADHLFCPVDRFLPILAMVVVVVVSAVS
jgi:hypothetical protein